MEKLKNLGSLILGLVLVVVALGSIVYVIEWLGLFDEDESARCGAHKHLRTETSSSAWGIENNRVCVKDKQKNV